MLFDDFKTCVVNSLVTLFRVTILSIPFLRSAIILKPGEGPSRETMENGYTCICGFGTGSRGCKVETLLYFPSDIMYLDTARMLVESGLCLGLDEDKLPVSRGGFYTTATGMGDVLFDRLCRTGSKYFFKVVNFTESKPNRSLMKSKNMCHILCSR